MDIDKTSVLVVDDDAVSRELLLLLLLREGYSVNTADSGAQALNYLRAQEGVLPQVILTDLQMPGISGAKLARALRDLCCARTLLIAMSGSSPDEAVCNDYDAFLLKPFTMDQLAAAIAGRQVAPAGSSSKEEAPVLDEAIYEKLTASMSADKLARLFGMCLDDVTKRIGMMCEAVSAGDDASYKREAHAIKGGCGMVGALELQRLATTMENKGLAANHVATFDEFLLARDRLKRMLNARETATM